jgi:hypothetical protein
MAWNYSDKKNATLNVRKEQMEFEQKLVADLTNRISLTYDRIGKVITATSSTITMKV